MRDYAVIAPQFWTGRTGKAIREYGADAQRCALYLLTCPSSNAFGLYYIPLPTLCHEVGISEEGASKALRSLSEVNFAHYDTTSEYVWVPEMARFQIGESLSSGDKRIKWVMKELTALSKTPFFNDFLIKYREIFRLQELKPVGEIPSPFDAPSMPHRSQEQEQEQEQDKRVVAKSTPIPSCSKQKKVFDLSDVAIPESLNEPRFVEKWRFWVSYRMKVKKVKDPVEMFRLQLEKLVPFGIDQSIAAIDKSVMNGYQGIFPESKKSGHHFEPGGRAAKSEKEQAEGDQVLILQGIGFLSEALDNQKMSQAEKLEQVLNWSSFLEAKRSKIPENEIKRVKVLLQLSAEFKLEAKKC